MKSTIITLISLTIAAAGAESAAGFLADTNLAIVIISVFSSGTFSAWLSWFLSRRNNQASARKVNAEADNIVAETYGEILEDLKAELHRQKQALLDQSVAHSARMQELEERHQRSITRAHERIDLLEQSEDQAIAHVKNLEQLLRDVGVPLPATPWRPAPGRRRKTNGNSN